MRALRRALAYLRSYRRAAAGAFVALLMVTAANLVAPQLIRLAIDRGLAGRRWSIVLVAVGGSVAVALARGLCTFLQGYLAERASQGVAYDLRNALFERIERLSFSYYDRVQTGQLVTHLGPARPLVQGTEIPLVRWLLALHCISLDEMAGALNRKVAVLQLSRERE
jgi:ATP-binding cassette subfamily B protein